MSHDINDNSDSQKQLPHASGYHVPVLCKNVVDGLVTERTGTYVDATLGGGGHAEALLGVLAKSGRVIGIDQDVDAIESATSRLKDAHRAGRFVALRGNFGALGQLLDGEGVDTVHGLLLDLGVSSHQLDTPARGFSYRLEGALDMRMDQRETLTAHRVLNTWPEEELARIFWEYGELRQARRLAADIVASRPVETTHALKEIVGHRVRSRDLFKTLGVVFQAVRIVVNKELDVLEYVLEEAVERIRPGGRIAVISYHSLEDRRVKRFLRAGNWKGEVKRDLYGNEIGPWKLITRKAIKPDPEEIERNSRARSARLRIAERRSVQSFDAVSSPPD